MEPFIGQIMLVGFNFTPRGWASCDGQLLSISQNQALFSLLGTNYGGDGRTTFALPDLRGRVPMHKGEGSGLRDRGFGELGGEEWITLGNEHIPRQTYTSDLSQLKGRMAFTTDTGDTNMPATDNVFATGIVPSGRSSLGNTNIYKKASSSDRTKDIDISGSLSIDNGGGSQSHYNMQPFLALNYIIALNGLYPSRS